MTQPVEIIHRIAELQAFLAGFKPTVLPLEPYPSEIEELANDLRLFAEKVDRVVEAYGQYAQQMTGHRMDQSLYTNVLTHGLDGNLTYEISEAADKLREDLHAGVM